MRVPIAGMSHSVLAKSCLHLAYTSSVPGQHAVYGLPELAYLMFCQPKASGVVSVLSACYLDFEGMNVFALLVC